jgi:hypothetical protein
MVVRGWAISLLGDPEEGISLIEKGLEGWQTIGSIIVRPIFLGLFGEAKALRGDLADAIATVDEGIRIAGFQNELLSSLYLNRIKGLLLHKSGNAGAAEKLLRETMQHSNKLGARSFALAAALALAEVQRKSGSGSYGKKSVDRILRTYTEGYETPLILRALKVARA